MKRWIWLPLFALALIAAGLTLVARPPTPEWTTASPEALAEFQAGIEAAAKVYLGEAHEHYRRAIEHDPGFLIAKFRYTTALLEYGDERDSRYVDELMNADLSGLTEREQFIITRWRANMNGQSDEAERLLEDYAASHPNDPYGLSMKAMAAWRRGEIEKAEPLYQHLLSIDPNWVTAYNALGYMAMRQGRFTEAEEYFKSYRFVVPDQANPHDSLGELFITLGRYSEAEASLERAIEIKPDFWASYEHLAIMKAHAGDPAGANTIIERARIEGIPEEFASRLDCLVRYTEMVDRGAWRRILKERESSCVTDYGNVFPLIATHRAACRLGEWAAVQSLEDSAESLVLGGSGKASREQLHALQVAIYHMQGVRLATQGDLATARDRLQAVDDRLDFLQSHDALFKLYNNIILAEVLLAAGDDATAHLLLSKIRSVNPPVVAEFELSGFRVLGLRRS